MKKSVVLVAALIAAAVASVPAEAAKRKYKRTYVAASAASVNERNVPGLTRQEAADPNWATKRFVRDSIPVFLPTYVLPLYLKTDPMAGQSAEVRYGKVGQRKRMRHARRM